MRTCAPHLSHPKARQCTLHSRLNPREVVVLVQYVRAVTAARARLSLFPQDQIMQRSLDRHQNAPLGTVWRMHCFAKM
jgi:hypothetical protein